MNPKKLAFNISTAGAGVIAVVTYFVAFFESRYGYYGITERFDDLEWILVHDPEEGIARLFLLTLFFIAPAILALLNAGLGFALKPKGSGVFSIITGALGFTSACVWYVLVEEGVVNVRELGWGGYLNGFMFLGCIVCGILTLILVKTPAKPVQEDMYQYQPTPNYYNDFNQGFGGYENDNYNSDFGRYDGDDVTVKINNDGGMGNQQEHNFPDGSIFCVNGKYRGISFPISHGERVNIGRDPRQCNIIIGEESIYVGRKHCNIVYFADAHRYEITASSSNGIILSGGRKVRTGETVRLPAGTTIALGNNDNVFELR